MEQPQRVMLDPSKFPDKYSEVVSLTPGKNASVYRAFNSYLNQEVFLKVYDIPDDEPTSALSEPHLLQELDHENLVRVRYVDRLPPAGSEGAKLLLAMDMANGGSFQALIESHAQEHLAVHEAIRLVTLAANGLAHMHDRKIVHCDIKPANLILHNVCPKVTDLGLARRLGDDNRVMGSRHAYIYRPPEVWAGQGYGPRSDLYQLTVVLYQLLGGFIDFPALTAMPPNELSMFIQRGELVDLASLGPHIGSALRRILKRGSGPEQERHGSATEFILELTHVASVQPNYRYSLRSDGFNVTYSHPDRDRVLSANKIGSICWDVGIQDLRRDGIVRTLRRPIRIRHKNLASCRDFQSLLARCL